MRTTFAPRAGLLGLATAAALTLGPALPAAAQPAPAAPPSPTADTVATLMGSQVASKSTSCGRWQKNYARTLQVRACWRKVGRQTQPQAAFQNLTKKTIKVKWVVRYKTIPYGPWKVCKQGTGPLKPKQHWVTWCGWYKRVADVRATGTVVG